MSSEKEFSTSRVEIGIYDKDFRFVDIPLIMIKGMYEMAKQVVAGIVLGLSLALTGPVLAESGVLGADEAERDPVVEETTTDEASWREKVAGTLSSGVEATKKGWDATKEKGAALFNLDDKIKARDAEIRILNIDLAECRSTQRITRLNNEEKHNEIIQQTQGILDYLYDVRSANSLKGKEL